jgi:hypothetical protein
VHSSLKGKARKRASALLCAFAFGLIAAGCHHQNTNSGYGVAWISLTDQSLVNADTSSACRAPTCDFTSYIITVDSVVLTGKTYGAITAIAVPEQINFAKLVNFSELWSSAPIPVDTYTSATITLDYTYAQIAVQVDGKPVAATAVAPGGLPATQISVVVDLDPQNPLTLQYTYASTNAQRLAFAFDMAASSSVDLTDPTAPVVTVTPYFTVATSASDNKLIRIRGPLVNSSVLISSYSTFVRPFFDEVNSLGSVTIFNSPSTVYTLYGATYVGKPGIQALSQTSAGSTMTAAYTTFEPTPTLVAGINAGKFNAAYIIGGSTLEDFYTDGLEGDVIARNGDTLTLRGATLFANASQVVEYIPADSLVQLGTGTLVTADGDASLGPLNYNSVSVGQHITARGLYSLSAAGVVTIDSTGTSDTNTGSVRLQSTELWGPLISSASGSLVQNVQAIQDWPASNYNFAGNGTTGAQDPTAASFVVNTGSLPLPPGPDGVTPVVPGDLLWTDGYTSPFGSAPPDFIAASVSSAPTVPASMLVTWTGTGSLTPFTVTDSSMTINLSDPAFGGGVIRIGAQAIDMTTLSASPLIVPQAASVPTGPGLPPLFMPLFGVGSYAIGVQSFNSYTAYAAALSTQLATAGATKLSATGTYNPATNIFSAASIDVVL